MSQNQGERSLRKKKGKGTHLRTLKCLVAALILSSAALPVAAEYSAAVPFAESTASSSMCQGWTGEAEISYQALPPSYEKEGDKTWTGEAQISYQMLPPDYEMISGPPGTSGGCKIKIEGPNNTSWTWKFCQLASCAPTQAAVLERCARQGQVCRVRCQLAYHSDPQQLGVCRASCSDEENACFDGIPNVALNNHCGDQT